MKVTGIVCEYNPFHSGHKYLIEQARNNGSEFIIAVMSGNYVQRGVPAFMDKYIRSEIALKMGVDMIIELPVVFAASSSEVFASAAVAILDKTGIVSDIIFGSECADIDILWLFAKILATEPTTYRNYVQEKLKNGSSYATAKYDSLIEYICNTGSESVCSDCNIDFKTYLNLLEKYKKEEFSPIINSPNNNLGIEYLKAIYLRKSNITPITVKRINNNYHDEENSGASYSATALRHAILSNDFSYIDDDYLRNVYKTNYNVSFPIQADDFSALLGEKLLKAYRFDDIYGVNIALSNKIKNKVYDYTCYSDFITLLKTKEIAYSAISRSLLHILLGIKDSDVKEFIQNDYCDFIRILGFTKNGSSLMADIQKNIYTVINPSKDEHAISNRFKKLYDINMYADNLYRMIQMNKFKYTEYNEYTRKCLIL